MQTPTLKYKPCSTTPNNACGGQETTEELLINTWKEFSQTLYAQIHVSNSFVSLQSTTGHENESDNEPITEQNNTIRDEWMILFDARNPFESLEPSAETHNWHKDQSAD